MKRWVLWILSAAAVLCLCACGAGAGDGASGEGGAVAPVEGIQMGAPSVRKTPLEKLLTTAVPVKIPLTEPVNMLWAEVLTAESPREPAFLVKVTRMGLPPGKAVLLRRTPGPWAGDQREVSAYTAPGSRNT